MSKLTFGCPDRTPAKVATVSSNVPDGQSGPVAVKVFTTVAKLTCSVIVNGTCVAAWAGAATPTRAKRPRAATARTMGRVYRIASVLSFVDKQHFALIAGNQERRLAPATGPFCPFGLCCSGDSGSGLSERHSH